MNEFLVGVLSAAKRIQRKVYVYIKSYKKNIVVSTLVDQLTSLVVTHLSAGLVAPALLQMDAVS